MALRDASGDSLSALVGHILQLLVFAVHDHGEGFRIVRLVEGRLAANQHVQDDPERPDV